MSELLSVTDLPPSGKRAIWWGFAWRALVLWIAVVICSAGVGGILGAILGFSGAALGMNMPRLFVAIRIISALLGFVIGLATQWGYIRWLFSATIGGYQLRLVKAEGGEST